MFSSTTGSGPSHLSNFFRQGLGTGKSSGGNKVKCAGLKSLIGNSVLNFKYLAIIDI